MGWARALLVTPGAYGTAAAAAKRRPGRSLAFVADVYGSYEDAKRKRKLVDFDDLLALCHATMTRDTRFADAQRWRHRHVLVDEFQDVNPLQFAVLQSWLGPESSLVVVGDPNQAIYGWNGAQPELLDEIGDHLPGCAVIHLRTNFRSTPEILAAAARVLDIDPQPAARPSGDEPSLRRLSADDEAVSIARSVRGRHKPGAPWRHQAVLTRTNAQLPAIRTALEKAGIPVRSRGDGALLRRPEVMELIESWPPDAALSEMLTDANTELPDNLENAHLSEERRTMLQAFLDIARGHLELERRATVDDFLSSLRSDDRISAVTDGVELGTFHAAKGLEWPIVHLAGIEDGYVPISFASNATARAEERRLSTSPPPAERELHVSGATHVIGDQRRTRTLAMDRGVPRRADPPRRTPIDREPTGEDRCVPEIDLTITDQDEREIVRDQLLIWREDWATKADIAPTAVLTDRTVEALAEARPCRMDELAAIDGVGPSKARRFGLKLLEITCLDE